MKPLQLILPSTQLKKTKLRHSRDFSQVHAASPREDCNVPSKPLTPQAWCAAAHYSGLCQEGRTSRKKDPPGKRDVQGSVERLVEECDSLVRVTGDHKATVQMMPSPKGAHPSVPPEGSVSFLNDFEDLLRKSTWGHKQFSCPSL